MAKAHIVVDGSNLATEGRNSPSFKQLNEAVEQFRSDHKRDVVTVVVDATFGHRIANSEKKAFEAAVESGEIVTPPAGAIGRGDAFILQIADRVGATVLSNDSFQEFHGTYIWLFEEGRLVGGKPVPHVGWVFVDRSPVRGSVSRRSVKDSEPEPKPEPAPRVRRRTRRAVDPANVGDAFDALVANHPPGSELPGVVEQFSSHGAYVMAADVRCYVPTTLLGDPQPRSAKDVLNRGETYDFVVHTIDTEKRNVDLAMAMVKPKKRARTKKAPVKKKAAAKKSQPRKKTAAKKS